MDDNRLQKNNILLERKAIKQNAVKKLKFLIAGASLLLVLFLIVLYASAKQGGFANLFKGDGNLLENAAENIGTSFTGENKPEDDPKTYNIEKKVIFTPTPEEQKTVNDIQNEIVFGSFDSSYYIKVKKDSFITFINNSGQDIHLVAPKLLEISLLVNETKNLKISNVGKFNFKDLYDKTDLQIKGTIEVVE